MVQAHAGSWSPTPDVFGGLTFKTLERRFGACLKFCNGHSNLSTCLLDVAR